MRRTTLTSKKKQEYLTKIRDMSNDDLFLTCVDDARGDDYDGYFTKEGQWKFDRVITELVSRLKKVNFLKNGYKFDTATKE